MLLLKIWVFASLPGALFLLLVTAFNFIRRLWS
jgi:hypothetical protein